MKVLVAGIGHDTATAELLSALKGVVRIADRKTIEFEAARAAIARHEKGAVQSTYIPPELAESAADIHSWMAKSGHKRWQLMDICSRNHATDRESYHAAAETVLAAWDKYDSAAGGSWDVLEAAMRELAAAHLSAKSPS